MCNKMKFQCNTAKWAEVVQSVQWLGYGLYSPGIEAHYRLEIFLYLEYIPIKTQLFSINHKCSDMFRPKRVTTKLFVETYMRYIK